MTKTIFFTLLVLTVLAGVFTRYLFEQFGRTPSATELKNYERLSYFKDGAFVSPMDTSVHPEKMENKGGMAGFFLQAMKTPKINMPQEKLNRQSFPAQPAELAVYWLGHSSLILEIGGKRLLADPVFGHASLVPVLFGRYIESPLKRADLPDTDIVLITHNHYDHLERATIRALRDKPVTFVVPLGTASALKGWGVPAENIRELGWNEVYRDGTLEIIARPGAHYSGRRGSDKNKTLWNGYVIRNNGKNVYLSGDTGYKENLFKETGEQYGPFDLALLEIDAWNSGWPAIHLFPDQAVRAAQDVRAKEFVPTHWGVFNLALHPWNESVRLAARHAREKGVKMSTPLMGQKYVPGQTVTQNWWQ